MFTSPQTIARPARGLIAVAAATVMLLLAPVVASATEPDWALVGERIVGRPASGFGRVSMSGDGTFVAVADGSRSVAPSVQVYRRNGSDWVPYGPAVPAEPANPPLRATTAISDDGQTLVVGTELAGINGPQSGVARVYRFNGSDWRQVGPDVVGDSRNDNMGTSLSVSSDGSIVAISAIQGANTNGLVRVFQVTGNDLVQLGADIIGTSNEFSGNRISLSQDGRRIVIGAPESDVATIGDDAGRARVYEFDGAQWNQLGSAIEGEGLRDGFGFVVDISGDGQTIIGGAHRNDGGGTWAGHARVYRFDGSEWRQVGADIDGETAGDSAGLSVAINQDGSRIAIGAPSRDEAASNAGQVRAFALTGNDWVQIGSDIQGATFGDRVGTWLAISDDGATIATGAVDAQRGGFVEVYELGDPAPAGDLCDGQTVTISGSGQIDGTSGDDVILGSSGADTIRGLGGNDVICAGGGDDIVFGGAGMDRIFGGAGEDRMNGGGDADMVFGGAGDDVLYGNRGDDQLGGGAGDDRVIGGPGNDSLGGGAGDDFCRGSAGQDRYFQCETTVV